jgi:hypothetical protein
VPKTATCIDANHSQGKDGSTQDCSPYLCDVNGSCKSTCATTEDCVAGKSCDTSSGVGQCVDTSAGSTGSQGGCAFPGSGRGAEGATSLACLGIAIAFGARRRAAKRR